MCSKDERKSSIEQPFLFRWTILLKLTCCWNFQKTQWLLDFEHLYKWIGCLSQVRWKIWAKVWRKVFICSPFNLTLLSRQISWDALLNDLISDFLCRRAIKSKWNCMVKEHMGIMVESKFGLERTQRQWLSTKTISVKITQVTQKNTCCESSQNLYESDHLKVSSSKHTPASWRITVGWVFSWTESFLGNLFRSAVVPMVTGHLWFADKSERNGVGRSTFPW